MNRIKTFFDTILSCSCFNRKKDDNEGDSSNTERDLKSKRSQAEEIELRQKSVNIAVNQAFDIESVIERPNHSDVLKSKSSQLQQPQSSPTIQSTFSSEDEEFEKFKSRKVKRSQPQNEVDDKDVKLMMLGDSNVGKSKLIMKYICGDFSDDYEPTENTPYRRRISHEGEDVQYNIIDAVFSPTHDQFTISQDEQIRNADGFFLVFDMTNRDTFNSLSWYRDNILRVKNADNLDYIIIMIGNKSDTESEKQVDKLEAQQLANDYSVKYYETSALNGNNVEKAFTDMMRSVRMIKRQKTIDKDILFVTKSRPYEKPTNFRFSVKKVNQMT